MPWRADCESRPGTLKKTMHTGLILPVLFALLAGLFACVGQAGGVGYVGAMALFGFPALTIKTTALALTLLVSAIGLFRYQRSGLLATRDWYPFALLGAPLSLVGGFINLPGQTYRFVLAALLLGAAAQMLWRIRAAAAEENTAAEIPFWPALMVGAVTGLIAGITGVGAGVFLAAAMMSLKWASMRRVAAVAQASNFFTALPALAAVWISAPALPPQLPVWALAAGIGGVTGAWLGTKHLPAGVLRLILALILIASGLKLALG